MKVKVRPPDAKGKKDDVEMDINPDELLESVRQKITKKLDVECHKLIHKGVSLKDEMTLRSHDILEGATLVVQAQYHGMYLPMGVQPGMDKKRPVEDLELEVQELAPEAKRMATAAAAKDIMEADIPWIKARCAFAGDKGMRRQMEDEHVIVPSLREQCPDLSKERDFALLAIFDGHGGKQVAGFIKTYLAVELGNAFLAEEGDAEAPLSDKRLKKAVEATFTRLDNRIATELAGCYDGCTAVVLLINPTTVFAVNLGDSMAYLCRQSPSDDIMPVPLQMRQHKCWMMKEKERILRSGGTVENGRINGVLEVSRAFGDIALKKFGVLCTPDYMKFKVDDEKDQYIILACDGFWNAWAPAEALEMCSEVIANEEARAGRDGEAPNLKECCSEMVKHVIEEKKAQDNVSVLIVRLNQETNVSVA
mmetsp:Transcript_26471/g.61719  ORF Transcript_26471/g.61719 Transcript_26471/m.61719 type:complete len:422 (+) Transcript_26471:75-1340(+)